MTRWTLWLCLAAGLSLLGLGCGSSGAGGATGVTVTVTPKTATVFVTGTQQFFANVTGGGQVATIASSNGAVRAANVVTITTTSPHGLSTGQTVTISGVSDSSFNGTFVIATVPSTTTFTYAQTGANATSGGGTVATSAVKWFVNSVEGGNATFGTISTTGLYTAPGALPTVPIASSGAVRSNNVVTITTTAAHNLAVGQMATISGVTDPTFNGTFTVASVPSSTTFTYPQTAANATSGGGTVTLTAVQIKAVAIADNTKSDTATVTLDSGIKVTVSPATATVGTGGAVASIAPSNGAVRATNVVTITTTSPHGLSTGQTVTISGVSDSSFNGTFVIATVPSTTTFTYAQTGANATSGGGTVATGENFRFNSAVTCPTSSCGGVTWSLNPATGSGTIDANTGVYTAPATVPSPATATVTATSQADTTKTGTATVTIVMAADPTLTAINPTSAAQGSLFQDVYLTGTNFISTTQVLFNGVPVDSSRITAVSGTLLRVRLDTLLATATPPAGVPVTVRRQNGMPTPAQNFTIVPVRPALVGASPDSGTQGSPAANFNFNGGYYGPSGSATVSPVFDGGPKFATGNNPRQLSVVLGPGDLTAPGLISFAVRNNAPPGLAAVANFAVQPSAGSASQVAGSPITVGSLPGAVAIDTATGIAVVANRGSNNIMLIALTAPVAGICPGLTTFPAVCGPPITVGTSPTGVAVDNVRHLAVVANNGSNSVSIIDLTTGNVLGSPIAGNINARPFSVGVNPQTGLALVTYQPVAPAVGTNVASIIDLTSSPPAVVGAVTISAGNTPQVATEPRLNWALVTPGGTVGSLSIVDLGRRSSSAIAPTGASCSANTATITTTAPHGLSTMPVPSAVLITGVAVSAFNGYFTVASVPSSTTFTYTLTCATPLSSGGGTAFSSNPLATVTLGTGVTGVAINPETEKGVLADPTTNTLTFFSVLDQTVTSLNLNSPPPPAPPDNCQQGVVCAFATAVNPLTDTAVSVNPFLNQASIIDPRTPQRLGIPIGVGTGPKAVAIDPGSNLAVIANEGSNNVSILSLGAIRPLHITQLVLPTNRQFSPSNPTATLASATDLPLTIIGKGFQNTSQVRLDGTALPAGNVMFRNERRLDVTVPAASFLTSARRYAVDVLNPSGALSNVADLTVVQAVSVASTGCAVPAPRAVAVDPERNLAVVTNTGTGCNNISLINLNTGAVNTLAVGKNPQGVAVVSRLGKAVVTNRDDGTASLVDFVAQSVNPTAVTVGTQPVGVAINQDTAQAVVANSGSSSISIFSADTGGTPNTVTVDQRPVAVAIDSIRNLALVANAGPSSNNLNQIDLSQPTPTVAVRYPCQQNPTGVVFDPASNLFVAACALNNSLVLVDPAAQQSTSLRVGINPTSLANNFLSSTLVTVNTASNTMTAVDFLDRRVRAILGMTGSQQFSIDIHPRTNLAVIADENNNRVLLVPLPR